jgi:hypothetical protein
LPKFKPLIRDIHQQGIAMKKFTVLIILSVLLFGGCRELNRFHEKEIALEVSYINKLLDEISEATINKDMEIFGRHFINDSSLIWNTGDHDMILSGWEPFSNRHEMFIRTRDIFEMDLKDRFINIDDHGNVAWFIQKYLIKYQMNDTIYHNQVLIQSGVLTHLGDKWSIVQWQEKM